MILSQTCDLIVEYSFFFNHLDLCLRVYLKVIGTRSYEIMPNSSQDLKCNDETSRQTGPRHWLILLATFYFTFFVDGFSYIFGVLAISIQNSYPEYHPSIIFLTGAIVPVLYGCLAPIGIALSEIYGSRYTTVAASLISTSGFLLCWINEIFLQMGFPLDFFSIGVLQGLAFALLYGPAINTIPTYFDNSHKSLAVGITTCGSPTGAIFFGFLIDKLINATSWQCAMLIFAVFAAIVAIAALAFPGDEVLSGRLDFNDFSDSQRTIVVSNISNMVEQTTSTDVFNRFFSIAHCGNFIFLISLVAGVFSVTGGIVPMVLVPVQSTEATYNVSRFVQSNIIQIWVPFKMLSFFFLNPKC